MKAKVVILILLVNICLIAVASEDNTIDKLNELLILEKSTILYDSETGNSGQIRILDFLEKVFLVKEGGNKRIFVETENKEKGWVELSKTTFIPINWKKINDIEELSIYIPSDVKYSLEKGKLEKHRVGKKYIESKEDLIYAENNFSILINRSDELFSDVLENQKKLDRALHKNSNYIEKEFKDKKIIFKKNIGLDFNQELLVFFPYKKNNCISICISPESSNLSQEKFRTALKILFSFELKNEK